MHYDPNFVGSIRVGIDGDKSVQVGHHEEAMDELDETDNVLGLVFSGAYLDERTDVKVTEVDF